MLLVETYIANSPGRGLGLFAKTYLPKGTKYWIRNNLFDKSIPAKKINLLPQIAAEYFMKYGFLEVSGNWYLCGDNARFTNHSAIPNTENHFDTAGLIEYSTISKDISTGEEIFLNYTEICCTCKDGVGFSEAMIL